MSPYSECAVCIGTAILAIGLYVIFLIPLLLALEIPIVPELSEFLRDIFSVLIVTGISAYLAKRHTGVSAQDIENRAVTLSNNRNKVLFIIITMFFLLIIIWFLGRVIWIFIYLFVEILRQVTYPNVEIYRREILTLIVIVGLLGSLLALILKYRLELIATINTVYDRSTKTENIFTKISNKIGRGANNEFHIYSHMSDFTEENTDNLPEETKSSRDRVEEFEGESSRKTYSDHPYLDDTDQAKVHQAAIDQLEVLLDVQSRWLENIHKRALDVIKFNQVIIAAIITSFALIPLEVNIYLGATLVSFALSLWFCVLAYSPEDRQPGLKPDETTVKNIHDIEIYNLETIIGYNSAIDYNTNVMNRKNKWFQWGLWSSFAGILYFIVAVFRSIIGSPFRVTPTLPTPALIDVLVLFAVLTIAILGWIVVNKSSR